VGKEHPGRLIMVEGSHLFPMERPQQTALAIEQAIASLANR